MKFDSKLVKRTLQSSAAVVSMAVAAPAALAQDSTANSDQPGAASQSGIPTIVVTANKRAEDVQDVSGSIQAFSGESLDRAGITDVSRVENIVSGVNFAFVGNEAKFNVRGANASNTFNDASPIVGVFVDGVYKTRASQQTRAFFDVERLEFLKGPQGTLYGRNTFAGAMNLYTNKPDLSGFYGSLEAQYANFNDVSGELVLNAPLSDTVAVRVAGRAQTADGWIENLVGEDLGSKREFAVRGSLLIEPTDAVEVIIRAQHAEESGVPAGLFGYGILCRNETPSGHTDPFGSVRDCTNSARGSTDTNGQTNEGHQITGPWTLSQDYTEPTDLSETVLSLEANIDLGAVALKSITSYTDFQNMNGFDFDYSGTPNQAGGYSEFVESFTQELQFNSQWDGPLQLTAGAYYSKDKTRFSFQIYQFTQRDDSVRPVVPVFDNNGNPVDTNGDGMITAADNLILLDSTPILSRDRTIGGFFADNQLIDIETLGLYINGEFSITDQFRVFGGIRYSDESKELTGGGNNFNSGVTSLRPGLAGSAPTVLPRPFDVVVFDFDDPGAFTGEVSFDNVSWRAGAEFDVTPDIMLYALAATGFLSGAINSNATTTDEQDSQVYEIGLKSVLFDNTLQLNLSAHRTEYSNLLTQIQDVVNGQVITRSANGGEIVAEGIEFDAVWVPVPEFQLGVNAAYLDSRFKTFGQSNPYQLFRGEVVPFIDLAGERTTFSPEFTANVTASYEIDLGGSGTLTPIGLMYYSDGYNNSNLLAIDPGAFQESFAKFDARLIWENADGDLSLEAYVDNLTNEAVIARTNNNADDLIQGSYNQPRRYGVRARVNF